MRSPDELHTAADRLRHILLSPVTRLMDLGDQTFWPTFMGALVVAVSVYLWRRRGRKVSLKGLKAFLLPPRLLRHPSFRLDIKMYFYSSLYLSAQSLIMVGAMTSLSAFLLHLAERLIGPGGHVAVMPVWALVTVPLFLYLCFELGYWLSHYLLHRIDWLWQFHMVHHSAEILTPLTEWRQHPVEFFLVPFVMGIVNAAAVASVKWLFGPNLNLAWFWSPGLILLVFVMTFVHLRHSHVKLAMTSLWGHIFQSPEHHRVHHSTDPRHFDKNFGFCLSVWDWAFGTLYMPRKGEVLTLGLYDAQGRKDELTTSVSLVTHMVLPFRRAWSVIADKFGRPAASGRVKADPTLPAE